MPKDLNSPTSLSRAIRRYRRQFLAVSATTAATALLPGIGAANVRTDPRTSGERWIGDEDYRYRMDHDFLQLPAQYSWQTTHNVAVDSQNNLYVIHEGRQELKDHPSIFVFDEKGKFIRAFGSQFQGGGHGIEVRREGSEEFLYVCGYQQVKSFEKMSLRGNKVWQQNAPMDSGVYAKGEDTNPQRKWGRDRFMPTNFAFLDDGGFLLADGYGSFVIHRYDKDAKWQSHFGGPGKGEGKFNTPHGIWIDRRKPDQLEVVVCDRAHHTLQFFGVDGSYRRTMPGFGLPANIDTYENLMLVPELHARLTILDENNKVVARLGDDVKRITAKDGRQIRANSEKWLDGKFVHPHDACFDRNGDIFVAEWVQTGRITKLTRI